MSAHVRLCPAGGGQEGTDFLPRNDDGFWRRPWRTLPGTALFPESGRSPACPLVPLGVLAASAGDPIFAPRQGDHMCPAECYGWPPNAKQWRSWA